MRIDVCMLCIAASVTGVSGCVGLPATRIAWPLAAVVSDPARFPDNTEIVTPQLVIHADFPLARRHRLVRELEDLRIDVSDRLGLPVSDEPVHLCLFENQGRYEDFSSSRFPGFPARRAFFVKTDTQLCVYAHWQDRIAEDLRHETTHGYVHAVVSEPPLWLDEGIAEFFERPQSDRRLHRAHVTWLAGRVLEGTWRPDLLRLESQADATLLTQDHYAEAWCWVHWLLETTPERRQLLQEFLADVRRDPTTPPLSTRLPRLTGGLEQAATSVVEHVMHLEQSIREP